MSEAAFGPSALATPANALTAGRLLVTPVLLAMIVASGHSWPAVVLWIVLCASDGVDGHIARRHGTTRSGAFLDPLADKVLVLGGAYALVVAGRFWWLPVTLIAVRELVVQVLRSYYVRKGLAIEARFWAKVKTAVQEVAVGLALLPPVAVHLDWLPAAVLWVAAALTVSTGVNYVLDGSRAASNMSRT